MAEALLQRNVRDGIVLSHEQLERDAGANTADIIVAVNCLCQGCFIDLARLSEDIICQ